MERFTGGIIAAVGLLVASILTMIALDPGYLTEPEVIPAEDRPTACTMEWAPVCGTDGETYGNQCLLDSQGVSLDYTGECIESAPMEATVSLPAGSSAMGCEETDECYIPYDVSIAAGGTVTWINDDTAAHTVTSGSPAEGSDGLFDSSLFMSGNDFEFTFEEPGQYDYYCMVHPWMLGKVTVT